MAEPASGATTLPSGGGTAVAPGPQTAGTGSGGGTTTTGGGTTAGTATTVSTTGAGVAMAPPPTPPPSTDPTKTTEPGTMTAMPTDPEPGSMETMPTTTSPVITKLDGIRINGLPIDLFRTDVGILAAVRQGGLSSEGLSANAALRSAFSKAAGGATAAQVSLVKYLVGCALSPSQEVTYTDVGGKTHTFRGELGLAPSWTKPGEGTEAERQSVSACLMAHANTALPEPRHIQIVLDGLGYLPTDRVGAVIHQFDGVFFGDLFGPTPKAFVCKPNLGDDVPPNYAMTLLRDWGRQCYFTEDGCGGVFELVDCRNVCGPRKASGGFGPTCTVGTRAYPVANVFVPLFARAAHFVHNAMLVTCEQCLDKQAVAGLEPSTAKASFTWRSLPPGQYVLDIRYANGAQTKAGALLPAYLKVLVDGKVVKNGASERWEFPNTGGADVWRQRSVPVTTTSNTTVFTLQGAGAIAPRVDALSLRFP